MTPGTLKNGLAVDFAPLAATAGVSDFNAIALQAATSAYTLMGLDPTNSALVLTTQQVQDAPWIAEYYVLRSIERSAAGLVDESTQKQSMKYSQVFKQIEALRIAAQTAVESRGYAISSDFSWGRVNEDWVEPFYGAAVGNWW